MALLDALRGPGRAGLEALVAEPAAALAVLDYDGTLAPIVSDPAHAVPLPGVPDRLAELVASIGRVAVVTGRPAADAARFLSADSRADLSTLEILGQYGAERWDSTDGRVHGAPVPAAIDQARGAMPVLLDSLGLGDAFVEDKGRAVVVHVRRMSDPDDALRRLTGPLLALAADLGLQAEPGRLVVELRPPGFDKGTGVRTLLADRPTRSVLVVGDDLGDLPAFQVVEELRAAGGEHAGLLVCSGSAEETRVADRADLVVDGPDGVLVLLDEILARLRA